MRCRTSDADKMKSVNTEHLEFEEKFEFLILRIIRGVMNMKTITITIEVYDASTVEDVERAVSAGLDNNGIECTYNVEEVTE